jgi:uncharacterized protein
MGTTDVAVRSGDRDFRAALTVGRVPVRAGLVPLHPASDPSHDQVLFRHLARVLPPLGVAVLRFDRRRQRQGHDVPLSAQARDALAGLRTLRAQLGRPDLPIGLWGWSQGAWAAVLAASRSPTVKFLILVASTGVSPAAQMRYGTAEHVRRAGFDARALAELRELRLAYEGALRGTRNRASVQAVIDRYSDRPWFPLAWVPRKLPARPRWKDMDFDPRPVFARVAVPTLLCYGESDEWTPVDESIAAWRSAGRSSGNRRIAVIRPRGTTHAPTLGGRMSLRAVSPEYAREMTTWLEGTLRLFAEPNPSRRPGPRPRTP